MAPRPRVMYTPVWLFMSEPCVANDASTYAVTRRGPTTFKVSVRSGVALRYLMPRSSLTLSSCVGDCTLVVRNATKVRMSGLILLLRYRSLATKEWNFFASTVFRGGDSLRVNKFSSAGVVAVSVTS